MGPLANGQGLTTNDQYIHWTMSDGNPCFRMPAEWEPHSATLIAWPHQKSDWPGKFAAIPWAFAEIVRHLSASEPVIILAPPGRESSVRDILKKSVPDLNHVTLLSVSTDRCWMRDSGPIGALDSDGKPVLLDWGFNAWAKYDNWHNDDKVPVAVAEHLHGMRVEPVHHGRRVVLEGGSFDVNGQGLLLTTEECLLTDMQQRNPGFTREDYEQVFEKYLGVKQTVWLHRGIIGDDTHGHVDDLARFVGPRTVVAVIEKNAADPNYQPLQENLERLECFAAADGSRLQVIPLPMPEPVVFRGQRLPASYANFYIANDRVLVPTFNDPNDRVVLGTLAEILTGRKVVGIHAVDLVWGLGTLHCLTQQVV